MTENKTTRTTVWDSVQIRYAVVHVVKYGTSGALHDRWVLATSKKNNKEISISESLRVMGVKRMGLVFIHLDAPVSVKPEAADRKTVLAAYDDVSYRAIVEPKLPINIQNLLALLKLSAGVSMAEGTTAQVKLVGAGVIDSIPVPSDVTVFGVRSTARTLIGQTQKYDNEGKYFWDASVAVPVNKLSLLDYTDEAGTFTPKQINKQSVYGLINLYPDLVDLKAGNRRWLLPRVVGGIGLTGRPGESFMFGGAWGVKQLQFFVGSAFANHRVLNAGSDPKLGTSYTQRYTSHLTFGINVPVLSAIKKVSSGTKTK